MSWRKHETHAAETKAVKAALKDAGLPVVKVGHGSGTAHCWLEVTLRRPDKLHSVGVNGHVERMSLAQRQALPVFASCVAGCSACEEFRELQSRAYRVIADATGRTGEYNGCVLIDWRDAGETLQRIEQGAMIGDRT